MGMASATGGFGLGGQISGDAFSPEPRTSMCSFCTILGDTPRPSHTTRRTDDRATREIG